MSTALASLERVFEGEGELAEVVRWERAIAEAQARQLAAVARFVAVWRDAGGALSEFVVDELAAALSVSRVAAGHRVALAVDLVERLPSTLAALERGEIDLAWARAVSDGTRVLSPELATRVEAEVLRRAPGQTAPQLRQAVRRAVLRLDPHGGQARFEARRAERRIVVTPAEDGMAELWAYLPATAAVAVYDTVHGYATRAAVPGDERTADQRRADAFVDLLLGGVSSPPAEVRVTVAASTLLGADELPGELAGYGPIPAGVAREVAGDATWRRILTDPAGDTVLDYGRSTYRPPAALADFVRARDTTCQFPGCRRRADRCHLDHREPFPDGPTSAANLDALCPRHHRLKHTRTWGADRDTTGHYTWHSPTGRAYTVTRDHTEADPPPF